MEGAQFGKMELKAADAYSAYASSFGPMGDETVYQDPWNFKSVALNGKTHDLRPALRKAMNIGYKALTTDTGGAGTTDKVLVPVFVDPRITDITRKYTPFVEMIPRVTNVGIVAAYDRLTAKGGAFFAGQDAALNETNDTYARASQDVKFLYAVGRVTGPAQAAIPSWILAGFQSTGTGLQGTAFTPASAPNARQLEVLVKARSLREKEEDAIWNGNASTNADEFNGIIQQQGTTNQVDKANAALEYDDTETAYKTAWDAGGRPNLGGSPSSVLTDLRKIMIDTFRYRPQDMTTTLPFGVSSHMVLETMGGPVPMIPSQNLTNTSGSKQLWLLDMSTIEMRVLLDMTFQELAKTNDSDKFMLKVYESLVVRAPEFNAFIDNIK